MYRELLPASDTWDDCSDSDCTITVHPSPAASYVIQDTLGATYGIQTEASQVVL